MHIPRLAFKVLVFSACVSVCVPCVSVSVTVKLSVKVNDVYPCSTQILNVVFVFMRLCACAACVRVCVPVCARGVSASGERFCSLQRRHARGAGRMGGT